MARLPERKHTRLKSYDYSRDGVYFVTICTHQRNSWLGSIGRDGSWRPTALGQIAREELDSIQTHRANVAVLHSVVMPNHVHILLQIHTEGNEGRRATTCRGRPLPDRTFGPLEHDSLATVVGAYKAAVTRRWRAQAATTSRGPTERPEPVWQSRFHDHVVRNEADYLRIWNYICSNPAKWAEDKYYLP